MLHAPCAVWRAGRAGGAGVARRGVRAEVGRSLAAAVYMWGVAACWCAAAARVARGPPPARPAVRVPALPPKIIYQRAQGEKRSKKLRAVGEYSTSCTARRGRRRALSLSHAPERARHVAAQARDCGLPVILGHVDGLRHGRAAAVRRFVQQPVQERIVQPGRELLQPQPEAWEVVQEVVTGYGTAFLRVRAMSCCKPAVVASESTRIRPSMAAVGMRVQGSTRSTLGPPLRGAAALSL